ncbi:MAG: glycosyltransferase [Proteobacteria bacterium]|nr:glycosyltransferase [Pseudomonadota bacterium]
MRKICFVATSPFVVNAFLLRHLNALAECYFVSLYVNLEDYPLSPLIDARIRVVDLPICRKISLFQDFRVLLILTGLFRNERFDLVHSITPKAGLLAMLGAMLARVPRRYHTFTGQVWSNRHGFARFFLKQIDRLTVFAASLVFADSHSQCQFLERECVVAPGGIRVLGEGSICGVDSQRFAPDVAVRKEVRVDLTVGDDVCVFLFVGRLVRDKGVFDLLHAFVRLADLVENPVLWVVGPDEEKLRTELELVAGPHNNRIRWVGPSFVPERFMAAADVLVLPSYREGFGMVVVEAAACGIPSVAYQIDGVTDAVLNGATGLLVAKGNVSALLDAMRLMYQDPVLRAKLGRNAYTRVIKGFSAATVTAAWLNLYRSELGRNKAP